MVTAAAIATLEAAAPGRVAVGIGSGFTGRVSMGRRPMRWADVREYMQTLRALLRGETATWEGRPLAMLPDPPTAVVRRPRPTRHLAATGVGLGAAARRAPDVGAGTGDPRPRHRGDVPRHLRAWGRRCGGPLPGGRTWRQRIEAHPADQRHLAVRDQVAAWAADGITEIAFQPAGPDIPGELERFVAAAGGG